MGLRAKQEKVLDAARLTGIEKAVVWAALRDKEPNLHGAPARARVSLMYAAYAAWPDFDGDLNPFLTLLAALAALCIGPEGILARADLPAMVDLIWDQTDPPYPEPHSDYETPATGLTALSCLSRLTRPSKRPPLTPEEAFAHLSAMVDVSAPISSEGRTDRDDKVDVLIEILSTAEGRALSARKMLERAPSLGSVPTINRTLRNPKHDRLAELVRLRDGEAAARKAARRGEIPDASLLNGLDKFDK